MPKPTVQTALLHALSVDQCLTVQHLNDVLGWKPEENQFHRAIARLIFRGFASRAERGCYMLTAEGLAFRASGKTLKNGPQGPMTNKTRRNKRQTNSRDLVWRALRILQRATVPQIQELAGDFHPTTIATYLYDLALAGYVRILSKRDKTSSTSKLSKGRSRFALIRDTGPDAPRFICDGTKVFDPNTNETADVVRKVRS